jgi:hypothetical protein
MNRDGRKLNDFGRGDSIPSEPMFDHYFELYGRYGMWGDEAWKRFKASYPDRDYTLFFHDAGLVNRLGIPTDISHIIKCMGHRSEVSTGLMAAELIYNNPLANWMVTRFPAGFWFTADDVRQRLKSDGERYVNSVMMFNSLSKLVSVPPLSHMGYGQVPRTDMRGELLPALCRGAVSDVSDAVLLYAFVKYVDSRSMSVSVEDMLADRENPFNVFGLQGNKDMDILSRLKRLVDKSEYVLKLENGTIGAQHYSYDREKKLERLIPRLAAQELQSAPDYLKRLGLSRDAADIKFGGLQSMRVTDSAVNRAIYSLSPRIASEWSLSKRVDLTGQVVGEAKDLATLFAVYRHPHLEQVHHIYVDDDRKIVGHNVLSLGLTCMASAIEGRDVGRGYYDIKDRMKRLGASGFYLLHNHPTGDVTPSQADRDATRAAAFRVGAFAEFLGHIIIDHDKFSFLIPDKSSSENVLAQSVLVEECRYDGGDIRKNAGVGVGIYNTGTIATYGAAYIHADKKTAMLALDMNNWCVGWVPLDEKQLHYQNVYQKMREYGGEQVAFVTNDFLMYDKILGLAREARDGVGVGKKLYVLDSVYVEIKGGLDIKDSGDSYDIGYASAREKGHLASSQDVNMYIESRKAHPIGLVWASGGGYGDDFDVELEDVNRRFNEDLLRQINGTLPSDFAYQLGHPGAILRAIGMSNCPMELKSVKLDEKANFPRHPFHIGDVKDLPKRINDPLAVFSYGDSTKMVNIITEIEYEGKNFLVGVALNPIVKNNKLDINSVRNVFPKDLVEWVNWINQSKGLYLNKEKVLNLLDQQRMNYADVAFGLPSFVPQGTEQEAQQGGSRPKLTLSEADLDLAVNITKSFKNPVIDKVSAIRTAQTSYKVEDFTGYLDTSNIIHSSEKSKGENNFFSGELVGYSPTPVSKPAFDHLLGRLYSTGLATEVVTDKGRMRSEFERLAGGDGDAAARLMSVWHGSPHSFERFSLNFVGTGEGAQGYGYGLYFSDLREIGEAYAENLVNWDKVDEINDRLSDISRKMGTIFPGSNYENLKSSHFYIDPDKETNYLALQKEYDALLLERGTVIDSQKNLYMVKVHGDKTVEELNFMRWDKPLTDKQLESISNVLKNDYPDIDFMSRLQTSQQNDMAAGVPNLQAGKFNGEWVYKLLMAWTYKPKIVDWGKRDKFVSELLLKADIDGIQMPTGFRTRGTHEDSYNYVVFDDKVIDIVEHLRMMSTPSGEVYGFATRDGGVFLDPDKMNVNTPIHEFAHLYMDVIKRENPDLYDRLIESAKHSTKFEVLGNDPHYGRLSEDERAEEAVAFLVGNRGEEMYFAEENRGWLDNFRAAVSDMYSWIRERVFGAEPPPLVRDMSPDDFSRMPLGDLVGGMAKDLLSGRDLLSDGVTVTGGDAGIRFALGGERGAEALDKLDGGQERADKLRVAEEMWGAGKDTNAIWRTTGWERGADGKWRYELPDMEIDEDKVDTADGDYRYMGTLGDLAKDNELFDAYPELKDVEVQIAERVLPWSPAGAYDREENKLYVYWKSDYEKQHIGSTIAHEVQHVIQELEGFTRGSNKEVFEKNRKSLHPSVKAVQDWYERYMNTPRTRTKFPEWLAARVSQIEFEPLKQYVRMFKRGEVSREDYKEYLDCRYQQYKDWKYAPSDMYERTSGEVEARNVQFRFGWDPADRLIPPSMSEDVPRDKHVFIDRVGVAASETGVVDDSPTSVSVKETVDMSKLDIRFNARTPEPRLARYFDKCAARLGETGYPQFRGLNIDVLRKFGIGYDPYFKFGTGTKMWQALVIPTGGGSFVARNVAADAPERDRYRKSGPVQIFNREALYRANKPIFVVEGEIDALSIMSVGGEAVALGSTASAAKLVDMLHDKRPVQPLVLALDNDKNGFDTSLYLYEKLMFECDVYCDISSMQMYGNYKDANEFLIKDKEAFVDVIQAKNKEYAIEGFKPLPSFSSIEAAYYPNLSKDMFSQDFNEVCSLMVSYGSRVDDVDKFFEFYDFRVTDQDYNGVRQLIDRDKVFSSVVNACAFTDLRERMCDRFPGFGVEVDRIMGKRVGADAVIGLNSLRLESDGCVLDIQRHEPVNINGFLKDYEHVCELRDYLRDKTGYEYMVPSTYAKRMQADEKWSDYNDVSKQMTSLYDEASKCLQVVQNNGLRERSSIANEPVLACLHDISMSYRNWEGSKWITSIDKKAARLGYMMADLRTACDARMSRFEIKNVDDVVKYAKDVHAFDYHKITKSIVANMISTEKATSLEMCKVMADAVRSGRDGREWRIQVDKAGRVNGADFVQSGKPQSTAGNILIKRDVSTGYYTVNCVQKDGTTVCLSDSLDSKMKSNFDVLRREAEFYSLNKDVQEAVIYYVKTKESLVKKEDAMDKSVGDKIDISDSGDNSFA